MGEDKKTTNWMEDNPQSKGNTGAKGEEYLMPRRIEKDRNSGRDLKRNVSVTRHEKYTFWFRRHNFETLYGSSITIGDAGMYHSFDEMFDS